VTYVHIEQNYKYEVKDPVPRLQLTIKTWCSISVW